MASIRFLWSGLLIAVGGLLAGCQGNVDFSAAPTTLSLASTRKATERSEAAIFPSRMPRLSEGKKVYAQRCQSCHGAEGKPAAGVQAPSFAEKEWRRDLTTLDLMASLTDHAPIPEYSFRDRSLQERWDVLYYVWSLGTTADRVAKAQTLIFGKNCTVCHGDTAHGNGDLARVMAKGTIMEPPPRNLTDWVWMSTRTDRELFRNIKEGVRWSAMPPWKDVLTDQQIWEVLDYIRSLHYEE